MPNFKGGKNYKKGKKGKGKTSGKKTETPLADSPGLFYAQVKSKLGGDRLDVECSDGNSRQAIIPGSFYKKVWINKNDVILVQLNELNTREAFILYKYDPNEAHSLKTQGHLKFNLGDIEGDDDGIQFGGDEDDSDGDIDKVQNEIDKVQKDNKAVSTDKEIEKSESEKEEITPIDKKNKVKESDLKRSNERKGKYQNDDEELDIDNI